MKYCSRCKETKPRSEFHFRVKTKNWLMSKCKVCANEINKEYKKRNPERIKETKRKEYRKNINRYRENLYKHKYGITLEQYNQMLKDQNNVCAICNKPESTKSKNGLVKPLAVDHCHATGKVRALLCLYCNQVIGDAKENVEILNSAIKYLERFK